MIAATLFMFMAGVPQAALPNQPPVDSPPVVRVIEIAFPSQGNVSLIEPQTYLYYIHTRPSRPSEHVWVAYDPQTALDNAGAVVPCEPTLPAVERAVLG